MPSIQEVVRSAFDAGLSGDHSGSMRMVTSLVPEHGAEAIDADSTLRGALPHL